MRMYSILSLHPDMALVVFPGFEGKKVRVWIFDQSLIQDETLMSQCFTSVRLLCCVSARPACDYCLRALETAEENARRLSGIPGLNLPHPELCRVRPELHQACPQCQVSTIGTRVGSDTRLILFFLKCFNRRKMLWKKWSDRETYRF